MNHEGNVPLAAYWQFGGTIGGRFFLVRLC